MTTLTMSTRARVTTGVQSHGALLVVGFFVLHLVLAQLIRSSSFPGLVHAIGSVGFGIIYAATSKKIRNVAMTIDGMSAGLPRLRPCVGSQIGVIRPCGTTRMPPTRTVRMMT